MTKAERTKAQLIEKAQFLFWSRGYSNVSLREITNLAGVDVALVSRYFGSKLGLFEATIPLLPALDASQIADVEDLVERVVDLFASGERGGDGPSPTAFILMNANDPEVGDLVRTAYKARWQVHLDALIGDKRRAADFSAAMLGMSIAEKALHLDGIADYRTSAYKDQLRSLLRKTISG
ncbi:MAG: helix-turn-helix domain-containing protein [Pseudomonadota bacterium]